jgi:hypothetical protein
MVALMLFSGVITALLVGAAAEVVLCAVVRLRSEVARRKRSIVGEERWRLRCGC